MQGRGGRSLRHLEGGPGGETLHHPRFEVGGARRRIHATANCRRAERHSVLPLLRVGAAPPLLLQPPASGKEGAWVVKGSSTRALGSTQEGIPWPAPMSTKMAQVRESEPVQRSSWELEQEPERGLERASQQGSVPDPLRDQVHRFLVQVHEPWVSVGGDEQASTAGKENLGEFQRRHGHGDQ